LTGSKRNLHKSKQAMSEEYLTVAEAAARLGISPRAVQKRCASGSITAQRIGGQWQVLALDAMPTGEPQNEHQDANRTDGVRTDSHSKRTEPANERTIGREPNREFANQNQLQNEPAAAALLAQSREEVLFLRGLIEQRDRDAAELRAALRKALEVMPKALPDASTPNAENIGRENATQTPIIPTGDQTDAAPKQSAPRGAKVRKLTAWQRIGARISGIRE
jgi:excisionase family DNA binding protein